MPQRLRGQKRRQIDGLQFAGPVAVRLQSVSGKHDHGRAPVRIEVRLDLHEQHQFAVQPVPETGEDPRAVPLPRRLIEQLSGEQLAIPELRTPADAAIAAKIRELAEY